VQLLDHIQQITALLAVAALVGWIGGDSLSPRDESAAVPEPVDHHPLICCEILDALRG
jgi:hypothetical protein